MSVHIRPHSKPVERGIYSHSIPVPTYHDKRRRTQNRTSCGYCFCHELFRLNTLKIPACVLRRLTSGFRRVYLYAVHLTFNGTERRKTPSPLKIGLFTRCHSKTPCIVCPKQSAAYPVTPQRIPRGLYHAITPERLDKPRRPNQPGTISPSRSSFSRSARPDFSRLSGQGSVQPVQCSAIAMQGKCFLRLFCADFSELHQMYICGNTETNENRAFASFLQTRGISD